MNIMAGITGWLLAACRICWWHFLSHLFHSASPLIFFITGTSTQGITVGHGALGRIMDNGHAVLLGVGLASEAVVCRLKLTRELT